MIKLDNISHAYGQQILFIEASCAIYRGEKVALVGPNGAGKSTIFRMIMGQETPDAGQVIQDKNITLGYFNQDVGEMKGRSVVAETLAGAGEVSSLGDELKNLENAMADPQYASKLDSIIDRFGVVQARFDNLGGYLLDAKAREILAGLNFTQEMMDWDVGKLSGGWKMRVALARILLMQPDVMILDEPSNHLDLESILWLEKFLIGYSGTIIMTSHDRAFINRIVNKIIEIDNGELTTYVGNYEFYLTQREIKLSQEQAQYDRQQAMLAKERLFIDRFKAQAAKAAQVQSRIKKLDKIEKVEPPKKQESIVFEFRQAPRSGEEVVKLSGVDKRYGEKTIYSQFDFLIRRQERWCVMGVNGAGKSTLLKLVAGAVAPDKGHVLLGASVKLAYFSQHAMDLLSAEQTIWDTLITSFPKESIGALRTLAGCFGFSGEEINKRCKSLSGGEKARLVLALLMYNPPNFLILDEPTNHLDMATKEMLIQALKNYQGSMLFVSHDRNFLTALSNRVLEIKNNQAKPYLGGYKEYVEQVGYEAPVME